MLNDPLSVLSFFSLFFGGGGGGGGREGKESGKTDRDVGVTHIFVFKHSTTKTACTAD